MAALRGQVRRLEHRAEQSASSRNRRVRRLPPCPPATRGPPDSPALGACQDAGDAGRRTLTSDLRRGHTAARLTA